LPAVSSPQTENIRMPHRSGNGSMGRGSMGHNLDRSHGSWVTCCQLLHLRHCLRCRSWQQVLGKWSQQWVCIGIRVPELRSTVFWNTKGKQ